MAESLLIVEDEFIVANDLKTILQKAGYSVCGMAGSVEEAKQMIEQYKPNWVLLDIFLQDDSMGTDLAPFLQERNIGFIYISANTNQKILEAAKATQPYGFIVKPFREKDLLIMLEIARGKHQSNHLLAQQKELTLKAHFKTIEEGDFTNDQRLDHIPGAFQAILPFDVMRFEVYDNKRRTGSNGYFFNRIAFDEYQIASSKVLQDVAKGRSQAVNGQYPVGLYNGDHFESMIDQNKFEAALADRFGFCSSLHIELGDEDKPISLAFYSKKQETYQAAHLQLLKKYDAIIGRLLAQSVGGAARKIENNNIEVKNSLATKKYNQPRFEGIYGNSEALIKVLDSIELVASTPATVLVLGESGTGKERIAQSIHLYSDRKAKPFVTINCAALPAELIESELFGHEKGSFTGAAEKRTGKFEQANGGTIFLDEIGEMPLSSQVKLLRVLQERAFESVGGNKTIKVDVRVIAATNRNLEKEVAEGRFRLDLFYRLNVFPIELAPLRERKKDIEVLSRHFLDKTARAFGRAAVPEISVEALKQLHSYDWPGNIRELEHLIERTLIKTKDTIIKHIDLPVPQAKPIINTNNGPEILNMEKVETEHILSILKRCNGKVSGAGGAAEILGMPSTTLASRMKKLGIKKEHYQGN